MIFSKDCLTETMKKYLQNNCLVCRIFTDLQNVFDTDHIFDNIAFLIKKSFFCYLNKKVSD